MNIVLASALLLLLLVHIGKKKGSARTAPGKSKPEDLDWIDDLEILDAATDDFV